jgi:hypothetical protein
MDARWFGSLDPDPGPGRIEIKGSILIRIETYADSQHCSFTYIGEVYRTGNLCY